jgi:predicted PurR-regulated permease PerM
VSGGREATSQRATRASGDAPQVVIAPRTLVLLVVTALGSILLVALAWAAHAILIQLLVAVVLAMALEPIVQQFERRGLRRGQAVAIAFTVALIGVAAFAYLLIPPLVDEVTSFGHHTPELLQKLTRGDGRFGFLERRFHVVEHARAWIAQRGGATVLGKPALHTAGSLLSSGAALVAVAFLTLFIALGGRKWFEGFLDRTVKLSPLAIAVSVAAGAEIGGIVGALLGIPIAGALKVVSRELVAWRRSDTGSANATR